MRLSFLPTDTAYDPELCCRAHVSFDDIPQENEPDIVIVIADEEKGEIIFYHKKDGPGTLRHKIGRVAITTR